jgi:hypothetical protein
MKFNKIESKIVTAAAVITVVVEDLEAVFSASFSCSFFIGVTGVGICCSLLDLMVALPFVVLVIVLDQSYPLSKFREWRAGLFLL